MNFPPSAPVAEVSATPLAEAVRTVEPRLLELNRADEPESQLRRFARQLRLSAEREAVSRKDAAT